MLQCRWCLGNSRVCFSSCPCLGLSSENHRVLQWLGLEGTLKSTLCHPVPQLPLSQVPQSLSSPALGTARGGCWFPAVPLCPLPSQQGAGPGQHQENDGSTVSSNTFGLLLMFYSHSSHWACSLQEKSRGVHLVLIIPFWFREHSLT